MNKKDKKKWWDKIEKRLDTLEKKEKCRLEGHAWSYTAFIRPYWRNKQFQLRVSCGRCGIEAVRIFEFSVGTNKKVAEFEASLRKEA